jgi:DNA-directed RNA polymerase subunit RPC12/RpoP
MNANTFVWSIERDANGMPLRLYGHSTTNYLPEDCHLSGRRVASKHAYCNSKLEETETEGGMFYYRCPHCGHLSVSKAR